jgi:hypothetical protein
VEGTEVQAVNKLTVAAASVLIIGSFLGCLFVDFSFCLYTLVLNGLAA